MASDRATRLLVHLHHCAHFHRNSGYMPDIRETALALGTSVNMTHRDRRALAAAGLIDQQPGTARAIVITTEGWDQLQSEFPDEFQHVSQMLVRRSHSELIARLGLRRVPLLDAKLAAGLVGQPDTSLDALDADEYLVVLSEIAGEWPDVFAIEIVGESMIDAHILPGDRIILRRTNTAADGEIVAVQLPDGVITLKRFEHRGDQVHLHPENSMMNEVIVISANSDEDGQEEARVVGVYLGLVRGSAARARVGAASVYSS